MNSKKGFTLLEVLVVTVIAASVLLFAVPAYKRTQDKSVYTSALGALVELRGGVLSLRQDLKLAGSETEFPPKQNELQILPIFFTETDPVYAATRTTDITTINGFNLRYALFSHKYAQPFPMENSRYKGRYQLYICGSESQFACCDNPSSHTVACMLDGYKCDRPTKGLYYGAKINEDGEITQISDSCQ